MLKLFIWNIINNMGCWQFSRLFNAAARYVYGNRYALYGNRYALYSNCYALYSNRYAVYILWPESLPEGFLLQCTCQLQGLGWRAFIILRCAIPVVCLNYKVR